MNTTSASKVIENLDSRIHRFGFPKIVVSDNGLLFSSLELHKYCESNNIVIIHAPPYNPESNGLAERGVQMIKKRSVEILSRERDNKKIQNEIDKLLFAYRNTLSTQVSVRLNWC